MALYSKLKTMADTIQPESPAPPLAPKGGVLRWFANNPVVGLVSFVIAVISLALTIYFGVASFRSRELSFYVNPTKTTIVKSGQSSDLHVLYKGQSVSTDVTALQVAIWNAGKESIRPEHVLAPIILSTSPKVPILEVRIRHISRPVTEIVVDTGKLAEGIVPLSWKILEHNDGAIIQMIVAGPDKTTVKIDGIVEGQRGLTLASNTNETRVILVSGVFLIMFVAAFFAGVNSGRHNRPFISSFLSFVIPFVILSIIVTLLTSSQPPLPFD